MRLFVGNLPPKATEEQLASEFSSYGVVSSVDIKIKENANNSSNKFAFVSIAIDENMVQQCVQEFREMPFHGHYLTVSVAKESFLDKLKREREEAAKEEVAKKLPKKVEQQEESDDFVVRKNAYADDMKAIVETDDTFLVKKRGQGAKMVNGKLKIFGDPEFVRNVADKPERDAKAQMSEQKRLESLDRKKNAYKQQKYAIKAALTNGQSGEKGKKIIFGDTETLNKPQLLGDDDDEEVDFSIKHQFQGESGQKLLNLQAKFHGDKRFALNEDFRDDAAIEEAPNEFDDEKKRQLEILEGVVGRPLAPKVTKTFQTMLRYDPTKKEHEKYIKKDQEDDKTKAVVQEVPVVVSSEKFYNVTQGIEKSLKSGSDGFSLLKMLGRESDPHEQVESHGTASNNIPHSGKRFKYDSSDDEKDGKKKKIPKDTSGTKKSGKKNKRGLFRESFFIHSGDSRLQEGGAFFECLTAAGEEFQDKRQQLKQIVRRKIRKNQLKVRQKFPKKKEFKGKKIK